jgi:glycosyltransferase involved in cell wall biosynthesis
MAPATNRVDRTGHLSVVILTYNEEVNLNDCLASLKDLDAPIVVVDSGSVDGTVQIARQHNADVLVHPFDRHALQWKWALANMPNPTEWILGLDADQRLTSRLREEIRQFIATDTDAVGAYMPRRQVFRGRWIRHGGYYPKYLLKLFRRDAVEIDENDLVDHHFSVRGSTVKFRGDLVEDNARENQISVWIDKHNRYALLQARDEMRRQENRDSGRLFGTPDEGTLWLKSRWRSLPLYWRPVAYFLYRYILRLGFLDGKQGFIFHFLQGFWYRLLVDIQIDELRLQSALAGTPGHRNNESSEMTDKAAP